MARAASKFREADIRRIFAAARKTSVNVRVEIEKHLAGFFAGAYRDVQPEEFADELASRSREEFIRGRRTLRENADASGAGRLPGDPLDSEPPTEKGLLTQTMRHLEISERTHATVVANIFRVGIIVALWAISAISASSIPSHSLPGICRE